MKKTILLSIILLYFISCDKKTDVLSTIEILNTLNENRTYETVEIDISNFPFENLIITEEDSENMLTFQLVDKNLDGKMDQLLFQPNIEANSSKRYFLSISNKKKHKEPEACYSRFVPERTDDYAWENNKVAFRTFGPTAQKMKEEGIKGGTLTSGIDAWLKRVDYPIINNWYQKATTGKGSYHKDTGEGLDNFHVGTSRGVGGIAVKKDSTYYYSKNFTSYKTITTGPIRTSFILNYEIWDANGEKITESKLISLDYGQNLSKYEILISGADTISAGLTLHKQDGQIAKFDQGISYWEPFDDSELGQGLIATDAYFINSNNYKTSKKDESNAYVNLKVVNGKVIYYAGFGWKKSNQFNNEQEWTQYLEDFSNKINHPLLVTQQ